MLLFIENGVPPDVEEAIGPGGAPEEERAEIEAGAVLWDDEVDGGGFVVPSGRKRDGIEVGACGWVGDV